MASYLRPRRGKEATAKSQNIVLKRGEIFFETPAGGVGTGIGRLKMGDGSTSYASLPYFLRQLDLSDNNTKCAFTNVTAATDKSNNNTYLNNIAPTNSLKTLFQNIKQLLLNYNSQLTSLNNDLGIFTDNNRIMFGNGLKIQFGSCICSYSNPNILSYSGNFPVAFKNNPHVFASVRSQGNSYNETSINAKVEFTTATFIIRVQTPQALFGSNNKYEASWLAIGV